MEETVSCLLHEELPVLLPEGEDSSVAPLVGHLKGT